MIPPWKSGTVYDSDEIVHYEGKMFVVLRNTSEAPTVPPGTDRDPLPPLFRNVVPDSEEDLNNIMWTAKFNYDSELGDAITDIGMYRNPDMVGTTSGLIGVSMVTNNEGNNPINTSPTIPENFNVNVGSSQYRYEYSFDDVEKMVNLRVTHFEVGRWGNFIISETEKGSADFKWPEFSTSQWNEYNHYMQSKVLDLYLNHTFTDDGLLVNMDEDKMILSRSMAPFMGADGNEISLSGIFTPSNGAKVVINNHVQGDDALGIYKNEDGDLHFGFFDVSGATPVFRGNASK